MQCCQEEHLERLRLVAELSSVILGFEMVAFLQFTFPVSEATAAETIAAGGAATQFVPPLGLQLAYAASSAATVRNMWTDV